MRRTTFSFGIGIGNSTDPDVLKNSSDARDCNINIEDKARENFRQETGGEPEVSVDASVGINCRLCIGDHVATFNEFRNWMSDAYAGNPPDVIEAWVQHERKHMEQCYKDDDFGTAACMSPERTLLCLPAAPAPYTRAFRHTLTEQVSGQTTRYPPFPNYCGIFIDGSGGGRGSKGFRVLQCLKGFE
ncbi:MAG: hypothetical protein JXA73_15235 [Acidobacteria bacterium]|nr:hypothetical protein [Acidobacteriota bacterium]